MDDSCAVCADVLEWVAYGQCGHRDVCSTCVARLRFILNDRRCCICKTENPVVFVTKAMGDYTRVITDFAVFPADASEGKVGGYWYHESTQALFDDADQYRMIKAMCRLSCSVCDKNAEEHGSDGAARRIKYRSIEQLKGHLFHQHKLFMCTLCLEGRKVFICEQKLYSRQQLDQHILTGDSEVDGSESERGGFMGHPMCEFCKTPFYGDNELYTHMSTDHYTCHICQRQHPGVYDYYKNYDDLELHFRQEHFLCENESCLAKKFVVFQSETEMKRHNMVEHGGNMSMSRSKRNAALQIPTSFTFRRNNGEEQRRRNNGEEQRRGRGRGFRHDQSENQLTMAIEASLETAVSDFRHRDSSVRPVTDYGDTNQNGSVMGSSESATANFGAASQSQCSRSAPVLEESSFPPLSDREAPEPSSRYAQAFQTSRNAARLGEEFFPPLPGTEKSSKLKPTGGSKGLGNNTLAARLHRRNKGSLATQSSSWSRPSENHEIATSGPATTQVISARNHGNSSTPARSQPLARVSHLVSTASTSSQPWVTRKVGASSSSLSTTQVKSVREISPPVSTRSPWNTTPSNKIKHSASAPNLIEGDSSNNPPSNMVSAVNRNQGLPSITQSVPNPADVHTANKSLVERIRAGLGMDEDKFAAFKNISAEFRQDQINTWEYLHYVEQFGLSHLVLELARLCPDPHKQQELTDAYNANLRGKSLQESNGSDAAISNEGKKGKGKGKGKGVDRVYAASTKDALTDDILDTVKKLQLNLKPQDEYVETLSKDGYRASKGKLQQSTGESFPKSSVANTKASEPSVKGEHPVVSTATSNAGSSKQPKKTSKFHRVRLGDGSAAALFEHGRLDPSPEPSETESTNNATDGFPARGVWRNGGGLKLVAESMKKSSK